MIYTVLRAVSRSDMRREIGVLIIPADDPKPLSMHYHTARVLGLSVGVAGAIGNASDAKWHQRLQEIGHAVVAEHSGTRTVLASGITSELA